MRCMCKEKKGKIRIIAGKYKGKLLSLLDNPNLRPTPNRVRETLFNWLMFEIRDLVCLDAFAGSGALGIEALSRGAKKVLFLEKDADIFRKLRQVINELKNEAAEALQIDFYKYISNTPLQFDLIFLDPPFKELALAHCLELLSALPALKVDGLVYLESNYALPLPPKNFISVKTAKAGQIYFGLYKKVQIMVVA